MDTKGPEIRSGLLKEDTGYEIKCGYEFMISSDEKYKEASDNQILYIDYKNLVNSMQVGNRIYIDDGILSLTVIEVLKDSNCCRVRANNTHRLLSRKGVNLPGAKVDLPALSEKDINDLSFAVKHGLDMIFASFIRKAADVKHIREILGEAGKDIMIISKVENHEGVTNFDEILKESDGIMVARGDLGIEIPPEKVFVAQKMMIARCNLAGKPVICATQMLESMTYNPRPTRAEVSDVANAVLDGSDCVMLSAETARGAYPVEAVEIMHKICLEAESSIAYTPLYEELRSMVFQDPGVGETIACSAVNAALQSYIHGIIVLTISGKTAKQVARFRPKVPIVTVTRTDAVARQIHLWRGCYPLIYPESQKGEVVGDVEKWQDDVDSRIFWAMEESKKMGLLQAGHNIVAIQGWKGGVGNTNTLRILQVP